MSGTVRVNSRVLRQRMLDLGLSDRRAAALVGVGQATIRNMTTDGILGGQMTVSTLRRLLDETGLTADDLLDTPAEPTDDASGDQRMLAQVLLADTRMHPRERLAVALGWTLTRLDRAMTDLDAVLEPAGLKVHVNGMGVTLRAADTLADDAVRRLQAARDVSEGLDNADARLLRRALLGKLGKNSTRKTDQPRVASLHRQGVLTVAPSDNGTGHVRLTDAAAHAFDVD
jgi:transcriptional regulator with XRE-family HTH domain